MNTQREKGFTLIEMAATIAIISILASIVFGSLSGVRARNRVQTATALLNAARSAAMVCVYRSSALNNPGSGGGLVCPQTDIIWPRLPAGWTYGAVSSPAGSRTYSFSATGDSVTITCSDSIACR